MFEEQNLLQSVLDNFFIQHKKENCIVTSSGQQLDLENNSYFVMPLFTRSKFGIYSLIINEQITNRNYTKLELIYVSTLQIGCQTKY